MPEGGRTEPSLLTRLDVIVLVIAFVGAVGRLIDALGDHSWWSALAWLVLLGFGVYAIRDRWRRRQRGSR